MKETCFAARLFFCFEFYLAGAHWQSAVSSVSQPQSILLLRIEPNTKNQEPRAKRGLLLSRPCRFHICRHIKLFKVFSKARRQVCGCFVIGRGIFPRVARVQEL